MKVLDFGLAKLLPQARKATVVQTLTQPQKIMGTLPLWHRSVARRGYRCAQRCYALGAVLYEMAIGQRPFPVEQPTQLTDAILHQAPQRPSQANQGVSPAPESIILKCLSKEPERRYQSVKDLRVDLRRLGESTAGTSPPRLHIVKIGRWALVAVAIAILVSAVLSLNVGRVRERLLGRAGLPQIQSLAVCRWKTSQATPPRNTSPTA